MKDVTLLFHFLLWFLAWRTWFWHETSHKPHHQLVSVTILSLPYQADGLEQPDTLLDKTNFLHNEVLQPQHFL